jgi:hypothetical protein
VCIPIKKVGMKWKRSEKARLKTGIAGTFKSQKSENNSHERKHQSKLKEAKCTVVEKEATRFENCKFHNEGKREYTIHPIPLAACESNILCLCIFKMEIFIK